MSSEGIISEHGISIPSSPVKNYAKIFPYSSPNDFPLSAVFAIAQLTSVVFCQRLFLILNVKKKKTEKLIKIRVNKVFSSFSFLLRSKALNIPKI